MANKQFSTGYWDREQGKVIQRGQIHYHALQTKKMYKFLSRREEILEICEEDGHQTEQIKVDPNIFNFFYKKRISSKILLENSN